MTMQAWVAELQTRHIRCCCNLEIFLWYFKKIVDDHIDHAPLVAHYLQQIQDKTPDFPDCYFSVPEDDPDFDYDSDFFDWHYLQRFCRNRKNATIIRLMHRYENTTFIGHLPTACKVGDVDDCMREGVIYHDAYDALEKERNQKAITFLFCVKHGHPTFYAIKDMRRTVSRLITDCSVNNLHTDPKVAILFKPPQ